MERMIHPTIHSLTFSLESEREDVICIPLVTEQRDTSVADTSRAQVNGRQKEKPVTVASETSAAADTSGMEVSDEEEEVDDRYSCKSDSTLVVSPSKLTVTQKDINDYLVQSKSKAANEKIEIVDISTEPELIDLDLDMNEEDSFSLAVSDDVNIDVEVGVATTNGDKSSEETAEEGAESVSVPSKRTLEEAKEGEEDSETEDSHNLKKLKVPDSQIEDFTSMLNDFVA